MSTHKGCGEAGCAEGCCGTESCLPGKQRAADTTSLQQRVAPWVQACFGPVIAADKSERNHRFLEEALELVQACGCTQSEAHQLVDYVFGRPVGERSQEVGGVMITLAALCLAQNIDMHEAGEVELARIWTMVEKIRAKQAAKPKHSPLPAARSTKPFLHIINGNEIWLSRLDANGTFEPLVGPIPVPAEMRAAIALTR